MGVNLRPAVEADAEACGRIIHEAFKGIAERHGFPPDFPTEEAGRWVASFLIGHPSVFGVVAEDDGRVVGSNFLDERNPIRGVGPIAVDPNSQARGIGRRLMQTVLERGQGAPGIRLIQDAFNSRSMSLYASLGFDVREPLALVNGTPQSLPSAGVEVRHMKAEDLEPCAHLCSKLHKFERVNELQDAVKRLAPFVVLRRGRVTAYCTAATFWPLNHGVAETESDMKELLMGAGVQSVEPLAFLLPTREATFFRWCLSEGFRVVKPLTLMAIGEYQEPRGCWFPSVLY
ncbi:MAG: GNAT family N-acetyltransferase [Acidobacteria bacterium]|nr:GNAT family N-acetyltransferase [Acidobacteriota bacterium]